MPVFTIDLENNITANGKIAENMQSFSTEKELAKLAAQWPGSRLVDTWNGFAGVAPFSELRPIKKFTNRKVAVARIWGAIQRLVRDGAPQAQHARSSKGEAIKSSASKRARKARPAETRGSKKAEVIAMLKRANGATLPEIMAATGWQKHTVRGFMSILSSRGGLKVKSSKNATGDRTYRVGK